MRRATCGLPVTVLRLTGVGSAPALADPHPHPHPSAAPQDPLAGARRPGADTWSAGRRKAFGIDLKDRRLLIASETSSTSKPVSGPADWKPTSHAFRCTDAEDHYTHIKSGWKPAITGQEKTALSPVLVTCTT